VPRRSPSFNSGDEASAATWRASRVEGSPTYATAQCLGFVPKAPRAGVEASVPARRRDFAEIQAPDARAKIEERPRGSTTL
jgi:hypothetical protein